MNASLCIDCDCFECLQNNGTFAGDGTKCNETLEECPGLTTSDITTTAEMTTGTSGTSNANSLPTPTTGALISETHTNSEDDDDDGNGDGDGNDVQAGTWVVIGFLVVFAVIACYLCSWSLLGTRAKVRSAARGRARRRETTGKLAEGILLLGDEPPHRKER